MGTDIQHPVSDRVKQSFVNFDVVRVPRCQNYKWRLRLNPVWHRMLYSCTHMATVGVKELSWPTLNFTVHVKLSYRVYYRVLVSRWVSWCWRWWRMCCVTGHQSTVWCLWLRSPVYSWWRTLCGRSSVNLLTCQLTVTRTANSLPVRLSRRFTSPQPHTFTSPSTHGLYYYYYNVYLKQTNRC